MTDEALEQQPGGGAADPGPDTAAPAGSTAEPSPEEADEGIEALKEALAHCHDRVLPERGGN